MPGDFLTINYRGASTPIISLYRPTAPIPVAFWGSAFGSLDSGTSNNNCAMNRVIKFYGYRPPSSSLFEAFYAAVGDQVYQSTDYGMTWTSVYTLSPLTANTINKSGLNIVYLNGLPTLCIFWYNSPTARWYGAYTLDGTTWTTHGPFTLAASTTNGLTSDIVYGNSVYCVTNPGSNGYAVNYDPGSGNMTSITLTGASTAGCACLAEYNNRLFCLYTITTATDSRLSEIVSGTLSNITSSIHGSGVTGTGNMCSLFADPTDGNLYGIFHGPTGFVAYQWTSSLGTPTNISSTVLPTSLSTTAATARLIVFVDQIEISGYPRIYLWYAPDGDVASLWVPLTWNGASAVITSMSGATAQGTVGSAMPANRSAPGPYYWYPYAPYSIILSREYTSSGIVLSLRLYGASTNNNAFRAFYSTGSEEYPIHPCTLTSPSSGTVVGGNIVRNIAPGTPSGTAFTVTWNATADGLSTGDGFQLVCENFLL